MNLTRDYPVRERPSDAINVSSMCAKGDGIVHWVQNHLRSHLYKDLIIDVINISGISNSEIDLIFTIIENDTRIIKGVQVKTLSRSGNSWAVRIDDQDYPQDTIMIFVNEAKSVFVVGFWKEFNTTTTSIRVLEDNQEHFFNKVEDFVNKLRDIIKVAPAITNILDTIKCKYQIREFNAIRTIKDLADIRNIKFEYHWTSDSSIDIYLDNHSCQCKTSSFTNGQLYTFHMRKMLKGEKVPYSKGDVEYFIMQICIPKYKNDLCIIPAEALINQGNIKSDISDGKLIVSIAPPNHYEYHWSESFWNNYGLIGNTIKDPIYQFISKNNCCIRNSSNTRGEMLRYLIKDYDLDKDFIVLFVNNRKNRIYREYVFIVPTKVVIKLRIITPIVGKDSKKWIDIAPPDHKDAHWSLRYWNKICDESLKPIVDKEELSRQYVPIDTSNVVLKELHALQYELDCLEIVIKKQDLGINVNEIMDQKEAQCDNGDMLMKTLNIIQATIDTTKLMIKRKQHGFS